MYIEQTFLSWAANHYHIIVTINGRFSLIYKHKQMKTAHLRDFYITFALYLATIRIAYHTDFNTGLTYYNFLCSVTKKRGSSLSQLSKLYSGTIPNVGCGKKLCTFLNKNIHILCTLLVPNLKRSRTYSDYYYFLLKVKLLIYE